MIENLENEIWKHVKGYEGLYEVSNKGRVKSNIKFHGVLNRIMNPGLSSGYFTLTLYKNKTRKTKRVHRLVAENFIDNQKNKREVNHIDGNKLNNNVNNLEWCTSSENTIHSFKIGLQKPPKPMLGKFGKNHHRSKTVLQLTLDGVFVSEYGSQKEASRKTKIHQGDISECCNMKYNMAGGYIWRFKV